MNPSFRIPHSKPFLPDLGDAAQCITDTLQSGWLTSGPRIAEFEDRLCEATGFNHAICTSSCTAALTVAIRAAMLHFYEEARQCIHLAVQSFTYTAAGNAILASGILHSNVHLLECYSKDYSILYDDSFFNDLFKSSDHWIAMQTVIAGSRPDRPMFPSRVFSILDSAQGIPLSRYFVDIACLSFWPSKLITTGEGGCILVKDHDVADNCRLLVHQGIVTEPLPWNRRGVLPAYNFRMSDIAASLGISQIKLLPCILRLRREAAERYQENLKKLSGLVSLVLPEINRSQNQMYIIRVPRERRDDLVLFLRQRGIEATVHYDPPLHQQDVFFEFQRGDLSVTESLCQEVITLPLYPTIRYEEIDEVCQCIEEFFLKVPSHDVSSR